MYIYHRNWLGSSSLFALLPGAPPVLHLVHSTSKSISQCMNESINQWERRHQKMVVLWQRPPHPLPTQCPAPAIYYCLNYPLKENKRLKFGNLQSFDWKSAIFTRLTGCKRELFHYLSTRWRWLSGIYFLFSILCHLCHASNLFLYFYLKTAVFSQQN